jgi:hypothetical protein
MATIYTTDREVVRKRGIHTVYTGNDKPVGHKDHKVKGTIFTFGMAREVEGQEANQLKDMGHASTHRIDLRAEEEENYPKQV